MPFAFDNQGRMIQEPFSYSYLIKLSIPVIWEMYITTNAGLILFISLSINYLTGHFNLFSEFWLPLFLFLTFVFPFLFIGLGFLLVSSDNLISKYSPSYKKKLDFGELFRTLSGLLYFAGRQVAKADDTELNQLIALRSRLDAAIQYATNCQREALIPKDKLESHEQVDL